MTKQWYVYKDEKQKGPLAWEKLTEMVLAGEILPEDLVIGEGMNEWISGSKVEGLFQKPVFAPPPPPGAQATMPPPPPPPGAQATAFPPPPQGVQITPPLDAQASVSSPPPEPPIFAPTASSPIGAPVVRKKKSGLKIAAIVGASVIGLIVILTLIAVFSGRSALRSSEVYAQAMSALQANPQAVQILGEPIKAGKSVNGEIRFSNGSGEAVLSIPVSGPQNKGRLEVEAFKAANQWQISSLQLVVDGGDRLNLFSDPFNLGFVMSYPQDWSYEKIDENTAYFEKPQETAEPPISILVTVLLSKQAGGVYANLDAVYKDIENQYKNIGAEIVFSESGIDDSKQFGDADYLYHVVSVTYQGIGGYIFAETVTLIQRDSDYFYQIVITGLADQIEKYELIYDEAMNSFRFVDFQ